MAMTPKKGHVYTSALGFKGLSALCHNVASNDVQIANVDRSAPHQPQTTSHMARILKRESREKRDEVQLISCHTQQRLCMHLVLGGAFGEILIVSCLCVGPIVVPYIGAGSHTCMACCCGILNLVYPSGLESVGQLFEML